MAYAKHFKSRFFAADGYAYQVWLDEDGFAGSVTDVDGRGDPLVIEWGKRGIDPFAPVRGSGAKISLWRDEDVSTALEDLLDTETNQFRCRVVRGASQAAIEGGTHDLYWQGFLILDGYEDSTVDLPDELDLEAIDGIAQLKDVPYTDASGSPEVAYTGREDLLTIFVRVMDKIGHDLPFSMVSRTYADGVAKTVDPWANMEANNAVYYDENGAAASCYEVLKDILYRMNAVCFQREGRWWALDLAVVDGSDYDVYQYDSAGAADSTTTDGAALDIDTLVSNGTVYREDGRRSFRQPYGMTQIRYNHGTVPSLIAAGDFEGEFLRGGRGDTTIGVDPLTVWSFNGPGDASDPGIEDASGQSYNVTRGGPRTMGRGGGLTDRYYTGNAVGYIPSFEHGTETDPEDVKLAVVTDARSISQVGEAISTGQRIAFSGRVRILGDENVIDNFQCYWWLGINGTTHYFSSAETWEDHGGAFVDGVNYIAPPRDSFGKGGLRLNTWYDFEFIDSEGAPADGDIFLFLYGTSDTSPGSNRTSKVQWDDIAVHIIDENGEIIESALTQVWTGDPDAARDVIDVQIGPGPTEFMDSRVTWNGAEETDFENDLITPAVDFDQLTATVWMRYMNRFLEQRFETYKNLNYEYGHAVTIHSNNFFPTWLQKSVRHARDQVEFLIHEYDSAQSVTVGSFGDSQREYVRGSGTSGATPGGGEATESVITTKGDLIAGDASGLPARLPVSGNDRSLLIEDSSEALGVRWSDVQMPEALFTGDIYAEDADGVPKRFAVENGWVTGANDTGDYILLPNGDYLIWPDGSRAVWPASP